MPLQSTDPTYKNSLLQKNGFDPLKYEMDDDGGVFEKTAQQSSPVVDGFQSILPAQDNIDKTKAQQGNQSSVTQAIGHHALASIAPTVGGLGAGALASLALAPETGGLSLLGLLGVLGAGAVGGAGTSYVQNKLLPEGAKQQLATESSEHPIASVAGDIIPSLPFFNPLKGAQNLMGIGLPNAERGVIGSAAQAFSKGLPSLTEGEVGRLANAGINIGSQGGIDVGSQLASGQPFDWKQLGVSLGTGALLSEPTALGKKFFPETHTKANPSANSDGANIVKEAPLDTPSEGHTTAPVNDTYGGPFGSSQTALESMGILHGMNTPVSEKPEAPLVTPNPATGLPSGSSSGFLNDERVNQSPSKDVTKKWKGTTEGVNPEDISRMEGEGGQTGLNTNIPREVLSSMGVTPQPVEVAHPIEVALSPSSIEVNTPQKVEATPISNTPLTESQKRLAESKKNLADAKQSLADKIAQLEAQKNKGEKYQPLNPEDTLLRDAPEEYKAKVMALAKKRGISLQEAANVYKQGTREEVRGSYAPDTRAATISTEHATLDTPVHEVGHGYLEDLITSNKPSDKALAQRALDIFGGDREKAEEFVVQKLGEMGSGRLQTKGLNGKSAQWFRDFISRWKNNLGVSSDKDVMQHLSQRLETDAPRGTRGEISGKITPNTTSKNQDIENDKGTAPVKYIGTQEGFAHIPSQKLYNLTENHPELGTKGSTIAEKSITSKGYKLPEESLKDIEARFDKTNPGWREHPAKLLSRDEGNLWNKARAREESNRVKDISPYYGPDEDSNKYQPLKQTETPEFKKWFGESKVRDENGEPLRVYHGTRSTNPIDIINPDTKNAAGKPRESGPTGFWTTPSKNYAHNYSYDYKGEGKETGPIYPIYAKAEKIAGYGSGQFLHDEGGSTKLQLSNEPISKEQFVNYVKRFGRYPADDKWTLKDGTTVRPKDSITPEKVYDNWPYKGGPKILDFLPYTSEFQASKADYSNHTERELMRNILLEHGYDAYFNSGNGRGEIAFLKGKEQVKSAIGNKGTFDNNNPDIRYQDAKEIKLGAKLEETTKPKENELDHKTFGLTRSEADTIVKKEGKRALPFNEAAGASIDERRALVNKYSMPEQEALKGMSNESINHVDQIMHLEQKEGVSHANELEGEKEKNLYETKRAIYKAQFEDAKDIPVHDVDEKGNVYMRKRKQDPFFHANMLDPNALKEMQNRTPQGIEKIKRWKDYLIEQGSGKEQADAKIQAVLDSHSNVLPTTAKFRAVDVAQGVGLPFELMRPGMQRNSERYNNRFASRVAFHNNIENNPKVAPLVGLKNDPWGKPFEGADDIEQLHSKEFKDIYSRLKGEDYHPDEAAIKPYIRVANSLALGIPTNMHIAVSSLANAQSYLKPHEVVSANIYALKRFNKSIQDALSTGSLSKHPTMFRDLLDAHSTQQERMASLADGIGRLNGRGVTDYITKGITQGIGDYAVRARIPMAKNGDKSAIRFMQSVDPKWSPEKVYGEEDIKKAASAFTGFLHGNHDFRTLPGWMLRDTIVQPFTSLMSWNVAQTNQFMKHVWTPATEGNFVPLIMSTLGAGVGGYILKEGREKLANKKSPIPGLAELVKSSKGIEGNMPLVAYNLAAMASYSGFGGILSTGARSIFDVAYKNPMQGAMFPLDEIIGNSGRIMTQSIGALMNSSPDDYAKIGSKAVADLFRENVQTARIASSWADEYGLLGKERQTKKILNNEEGDLRRFKMVSGMPYDDQGSIDESNPYYNMGRKAFQHEGDIREAAKELPGLIKQAMESSNGNMETFRSKLRALKESDYPSMPSPERTPATFWKYIKYLQDTQGNEEASKRVSEYMRKNAINKAKGEMVPSL